MSTLASFAEDDDGLHLGRWALAGAIVVATHAALIAGYMFLAPESDVAGAASPPLLIDFAPEAAAPESQDDLAPGEEAQESEEKPEPEVKQEVAEEPIVEVPPTDTPEPDIVIPQKKEVAEKEEEPKPKPPEPVKEKPVKESKKSTAQQQAAPKTPKRAARMVAPNPGSASSNQAKATYASMLSAHINRFKKPASGSGTAVVSFVVDRSGRVTSRRLARSSGNSAVDAEAMATIARAAPMPAFPAAVTQTSLFFSQAIRFN